jgi:hypothetical protein
VLNEPRLNTNVDFGFKVFEDNANASSPAQIEANKKPSFSRFPPLRLLQKTQLGLVGVFDYLLIEPTSGLINKVEDITWNLRGKPVFVKPTTSGASAAVIHKPQAPIRNIPKSFYAPTLVSTANFPIHRKAWHHARYKRPNWYRKYHSYAFVSYLHFSILMIFVSLLGYLLFNSLDTKKRLPTFAAPATPARVLSFQGRLTDASSNPINKTTTLRMGIYSSQTSTGSALLWQEVVTATPDKDGIFNILLGKGTSIPSTLFSQNSGLWLGVTVERTKELTPRQQIATVAFASNSETLQQPQLQMSFWLLTLQAI